MGLFISPLNTSTGLGIVSISLAMAALINLPIKEPAPVMATVAA